MKALLGAFSFQPGEKALEGIQLDSRNLREPSFEALVDIVVGRVWACSRQCGGGPPGQLCPAPWRRGAGGCPWSSTTSPTSGDSHSPQHDDDTPDIV